MKSSICVKIRQSGIKMSLFIQSIDSEIPALFEDNMFNGCISSISSGDASSILDMYGISPKKYAHDTSKELSRILADQKKNIAGVSVFYSDSTTDLPLVAYIAVCLHGCVRTHSLDLSVAQEFSQLNGLIEIVILGLINRMIVSDMVDSDAISNHEIGYTEQHLQQLRGCEHSKINGYSSSLKVADNKDSNPDLDRVFGDFFERLFGRKK